MEWSAARQKFDCIYQRSPKLRYSTRNAPREMLQREGFRLKNEACGGDNLRQADFPWRTCLLRRKVSGCREAGREPFPFQEKSPHRSDVRERFATKSV